MKNGPSHRWLPALASCILLTLGCSGRDGRAARDDPATAADDAAVSVQIDAPVKAPETGGVERSPAADAPAAGAEDRPASRADAGGAPDGAILGDSRPGPGDSAVAAMPCGDGAHPICLDFEHGDVPAPWIAPKNANFHVETGHAAHGRYAAHVGNLRTKPLVMLRTNTLNGIKDVLWGRYYLYLSPGAPWGHGQLVKVYDQSSNYYEVGFEGSAYLGMWTRASDGREYYMRSVPPIPGDRWVCVEFYLDGATPAVGRYWSDGVEVKFPPDHVAGTDPIEIYAPPTITKAGQFKAIDLGIGFSHGSSVASCPLYPPMACPSYESDQPPTITDMWVDDIAFDTKRIGCL